MNHVLLKYISKDIYAKEFLSGSLYMNSLYYFWNEYSPKGIKEKRQAYLRDNSRETPDEVAIVDNRKISSSQADLFEGTIGHTVSEDMKRFFGEYLLSDGILRSVGFQYCKTLCFYRLDYYYDGPFLKYNIPSMMDFGDYVVIIKNESEFLKRINGAAEREKLCYLCGDVHYKGLKREGNLVDISDKSHIVIRTDVSYDISGFDLSSKRDCFVKMDKYAWQKEWRVAIYNGAKDTEPYRLEIGDISDIAECVSARDLQAVLDRAFKAREIKHSVDGYYGNISRKELKEKYYQLGDNKAELFGIVGQPLK